MSKVTNAVTSVIIILAGLGFLFIDRMFSSLLSMGGLGSQLPAYASFSILGIIITLLGVVMLLLSLTGSEKGEDGEEHTCTYCGDVLKNEKALKEHIERYHQGANSNRMDLNSDFEEDYSSSEGGFREREESY